MTSSCGSVSKDATDSRLRSGGSCGGCVAGYGGTGVDVDFAGFRNCSSEAIDEPGVNGVPLNGLNGLRRGKFGDRRSGNPDLPSEVSKEGSKGNGLPVIGEASPLTPNLALFGR